MKIQVWGINYAPECTGIGIYTTELCVYLAAQGHEVRAITGFAYYPSWEKAPEDRGRCFATELIDGVRVHRCWQYVPRKVRPLTRMAHEASFVATSFLRQLFLPAPDIYIVASPPLLLGTAARLLGWIKRRPYIFRVLDLQPDAALGLGMVKPGLFTRLLYRLEAIAYRGAARVCGICDGMLEAFRRKGVPEEKILFVPDWFKRSEFSGRKATGAFRKSLNLPPDAFLAVYSGNIGIKQGLNILAEAAPFLEGSPVHIVICGEGAARPELEEAIRANHASQIHLRPLVPREDYLDMLAETDVALITQQAGSGAYFFPNKLLATLAAGNTVLGVADEESELYRAIETGGFGWNVKPGDARGLADRLLDAVSQKEDLVEKAKRGLTYVERYEEDYVLPAFEAVLKQVAGSPT